MSGQIPTNGKTPRPPTPAEQRQHLAEQGDMAGLWALWTSRSLIEINFREVADLLRQAMEVRVRQAPASFLQDLHLDMIGMVGYLVKRSQFRVLQLIAVEDESMNRGRPWYPTPELDEAVSKLLALQKHLAELVQLDAGTRRLDELARHHRLANDEVERKQQRANSRHEAPPCPSPAGVEATPINRVADFLNGS
jgi:hypothetical protein